MNPRLSFLLSAVVSSLLVFAQKADVSGCNSEQAAALSFGAKCFDTLITSGICPAGCCCVRTAPNTTIYAQSASCYLEHRIREDDVGVFRILTSAPVSADQCGDLRTTGCGDTPCDVLGDEDAIIASGKPVPEDNAGHQNGANDAGDEDKADDEKGGSNNLAIFGGIFGSLGFVVLCLGVIVWTFLARRKNAALAGLQHPELDGA